MEASALVTGGASGLGAAAAARLAAEGLAVTRLDRAAGDGVFAGDVTQPDDLTAAVAAAAATAPLRVCVTCAGIGTVGRVIGHDDDAFRPIWPSKAAIEAVSTITPRWPSASGSFPAIAVAAARRVLTCRSG